MEPIQKKSLAQEVADLIKHKIKSGVFAVDSQLPTEPELMKHFGVGRSSIREAIKYLSQSGFVNVQQGLGTFVISAIGNALLDDKIENADFAEVFEVRRILELKIIEKAALHRTDDQIELMRQNLKDRLLFGQENKLNECIEADIKFHTNIAESCGNSILSALYKTLSEHLKKFFFVAHKNTMPFTTSQQVHEDLLQAIEDKNPAKALENAQKIIGTL